jgi:predicted flap endonuclease-1-like 5' DNA nuclease
MELSSLIWILVICTPILTVLMVYFWLIARERAVPDEEETPPASPPEEQEPPEESHETTPPKEEGAAQDVQQDDLARIEGIGPKIAAMLREKGILTFAQLAETEPSRLAELLKEAGIGADPTTWPEQAALAAAAKWEELDALQEELKGGRRA